MKSLKNIDKDKLQEAVDVCNSKLEVYNYLNLNKPGNYNTLNKYLEKFNIDTSHFNTRKKILDKARNSKKSILDEDLFIVDSKYDYSAAKRRILKKELLPYKCSKCYITDWCGEKISLHLDHINGDKQDHRLTNLRLLCPNCHSQTDTYCGRNIATNDPSKRVCSCGKEKRRHSARCQKCDAIFRRGLNERIKWPSNNDLLRMIKDSNMLTVSKVLGVSDNAIRKRLRVRGIKW